MYSVVVDALGFQFNQVDNNQTNWRLTKKKNSNQRHWFDDDVCVCAFKFTKTKTKKKHFFAERIVHRKKNIQILRFQSSSS